MPYICEECREQVLDPGHIPGNVGDLTYKLTAVIASYLDERLYEEGELCYADLSEPLGALEGVKADYIERILKPYELKKRAENGDVWGRGVLTEIHQIKKDTLSGDPIWA